MKTSATKEAIHLIRKLGREKIAQADRITKRSVTGKPNGARKSKAIQKTMWLEGAAQRLFSLAERLEKGD